MNNEEQRGWREMWTSAVLRLHAIRMGVRQESNGVRCAGQINGSAAMQMDRKVTVGLSLENHTMEAETQTHRGVTSFSMP